MQEQELPIHKQCTAHSGVESRSSSILWLLGILITINLASAGWQFVALGQVKDRLADGSTQFALGAAEDKSIRAMIVSLEQRLQALESQLKKTQQ
ncbi:MAG TPA: hypothetical protein DEB35_03050 [Desulfuromonas sp.]|nr:hypothetical protein [Desulfuromonas sp.]